MLAITENGHYEPQEKTGVENFDYYMESLLEKLTALESPEEPGRGVILEYYYTHDTIGSEQDPLMSSLWGQDDIYGGFCPNGLSGCTPTAIAQVMNYHQHPASIVTTVEMGNAFVTYPIRCMFQLIGTIFNLILLLIQQHKPVLIITIQSAPY